MVVLVALAALLAGCASSSDTTEVAGRGADPNAPLPTAPAGSTGATTPLRPTVPTGSVDVQELVTRIDALNAETNLCTLLTGSALADVTGADLDLTSLLQDSTGFTSLFGSLAKLFGHMVDIAPATVKPDLQTMRGVWQGVATVDPKQPDAATKAGAFIADPSVQRAQSNVGVWVQTNCRRA